MTENVGNTTLKIGDRVRAGVAGDTVPAQSLGQVVALDSDLTGFGAVVSVQFDDPWGRGPEVHTFFEEEIEIVA